MRRKHHIAYEAFVSQDFDELATYNAERARGIVHTPEYDKRMAEVQHRFDWEQRWHAEHDGRTIIVP